MMIRVKKWISGKNTKKGGVRRFSEVSLWLIFFIPEHFDKVQEGYSRRKWKKMKDWHLHLDRALTALDKYVEHERLSIRDLMGLPLYLKQRAVGKFHSGLAFQRPELLARMEKVIRGKIKAGETELWACVDTTPDIGLVAFEAALELSGRYADQIKIKVGAYPVFGFKSVGSDRYEVVREAAARAHFLVGLPERDVAPDHPIGFRGHIRALLELGQEFSLPVQVHLDQANNPAESGTETLIEGVRWLGSPKVEGMTGPTVWAVHVISPSAYPEERFKRLLDGLIETKIGVIVCPHAAISMRQLSPLLAPTHNSIARVREMLAAEIPVRIGTDNIGDIFVGLRRLDLGREIEILESAVRLYDEVLWDKVARGEPLDDVDLHTVEVSLEEDREVFRSLLS